MTLSHVPSKAPKRAKNFTESAIDDTNFTPSTSASERNLKPRTDKQKLKAITEALDAHNYTTHDLPAHIRIQLIVEQLTEARRVIVEQVAEKTRLRRELGQIEGGQSET